MTHPPIDRARLRRHLHRLDAEHLLVLLDRAFERLDDDDLRHVLRDHVRAEEFAGSATTSSPLDEVRAFRDACLGGEYYEQFRVNSRNYREKSRGTERFIAECQRLLDRCVAAVGREDAAETRAAFEGLFELLVQVDDLRENLVFFADEHGAWQVGVDWRTVLPAWFRALAATAQADEYADQVMGAVSYFAHQEAEVLVPAGLRAADAAQRAALSSRPPPRQTYTRPTFRVAP